MPIRTAHRRPAEREQLIDEQPAAVPDHHKSLISNRMLPLN
jgi:hypothetical protein